MDTLFPRRFLLRDTHELPNVQVPSVRSICRRKGLTPNTLPQPLWGLVDGYTYLKSRTYYDAALMRDPDLKEAWNNKGRALNALERPQEALICLDKALEIDSSYHAAWVNRGIALALLGRLEGALKSFDVAIDLDPNDPKAWYNKGVALLKLNRTQQACQCAERALTLDPSYAEAKRLKETACHSTEP